MSDTVTATESTPLEDRAIEMTQLLVAEALADSFESWKSFLDEQYLLVTVGGVFSYMDPRFYTTVSYIREQLRRSSPIEMIHFQTHQVSERSVIVLTSGRSLESQQKQLDNDLSPQALSLLFLWTLHDQRLKLMQNYFNLYTTSHDALAPGPLSKEPAPRRTRTHEPAAPDKSRGAQRADRTDARLVIRTSDGQTHWMEPDDIRYVKACRHFTEIYCASRTLRIHELFKDVLARLDGVVLRVHRSYAVNPHHVDCLRGEMLYLTTGEKIPIPARRVKETRELLMQALKASS